MEPSSVSGEMSVKQEEKDTSQISASSLLTSPENNQPDSTENAVHIGITPNQDGSSSNTVNGGVAPKTEKVADTSYTTEIKLTKSKKKKKNLDPSAPRQPLSGYMRYLNDRRETVRGENPSLSFADITKLMAEEWNHLPQETKQPYVEAGQQDRERYTRELIAYKQTDAYRIALEKQAEKKARKSRESTGENGVLSDTQELAEEMKRENDGDGSDVHIFTDEFLDLNRACESEFRQLRAQNTEFEERNALLEKHNEAMKAAIENMEKANVLLRSNNHAVHQHLDDLRSKFVEVFQQVAVPGKNKPATEETVDEYVSQIGRYIATKGVEDDEVSEQLQDCVQKLDFEV